MDRFTSLLPYALLALLSLGTILWLFPAASPQAGIYLRYSADDMQSMSERILLAEGIDPGALTAEERVRTDRALIRQVQDLYGLEEGNRLLRTTLPGYKWEVRWTDKTTSDIRFSGGDEPPPEPPADAWLRGEVRMLFTMDGTLLSYDRFIPDSLELPSIAADSALMLARSFLIAYGDTSFATGSTTIGALLKDSLHVPRRVEMVRRTDHTHEFDLTDAITHDPLHVRYTVKGPLLARFSIEREIPREYTASGIRTFSGIIEAISLAALVVIMLIVSFRRFRAYEIGFRLAAFMGGAAAIGVGIKLYTIVPSSAGWQILFSLLLGPLFYGGGAFIVWAASESVVRETWKEKLIPLDLLSKGHVFHSRIGQSIVKGTGLGLSALAVSLGLAALIGTLTHLSVGYSEEGWFDFGASPYPLLTLLFESFYQQVYLLAVFFMFLGSWLYARVGNLTGVGLIIVFLLGLNRLFLFDPWWGSVLLVCVPLGFIAYAFLRFDVLTTLVAMAMMTLVEHSMVLYSSDRAFFSDAALIVGAGILLLIGTGLAAQFRTRELSDFDAISPAYAHHITERERLRHELSIARTVQMSFLPKSTPDVGSLDIASRCAPALEVGGDYYDFIELPDGRLAVAVGDVSGKGTQAAFFMTLTKGFLRALARMTESPGRTLNEVNRLFYENVDRGVFISLIYGVFDPRSSRLTIARAGHNPVILKKSRKQDTQVLNPTGMALGLDKGGIFDRSISEVSVAYEPGDVFVFYTDGISEAMNKARDEYGEERLTASIEKHAHRDADGIIKGILDDMHTFVGKAEQHDDVTLVVVKIR